MSKSARVCANGERLLHNSNGEQGTHRVDSRWISCGAQTEGTISPGCNPGLFHARRAHGGRDGNSPYPGVSRPVEWIGGDSGGLIGSTNRPGSASSDCHINLLLIVSNSSPSRRRNAAPVQARTFPRAAMVKLTINRFCFARVPAVESASKKSLVCSARSGSRNFSLACDGRNRPNRLQTFGHFDAARTAPSRSRSLSLGDSAASSANRDARGTSSITTPVPVAAAAVVTTAAPPKLTRPPSTSTNVLSASEEAR